MGWLGDEAYTGWWLLPECDRNCGKLLSASGMPYEYGNIYPKAVFPNGEIGFHGRNIFHSDFMIRPCILLNVYRDKNDYREYDLAYIQTFAGKERRDGIGERCVYHDVSLKKWRLIIQLDAERYYFLSVFIGGDGRLDKFSLDEEGAADSHYEFKEEREIRKKLYVAGDEDKYLDEILIRYAAQYGPQCLKGLILPYVTAQFHYD